MSTIPKKRWCTCTPLSDTTLPGHHGTRGLRIRRVDRRMNPNADTKPISMRKRNRRSLRLSHVPPMTEANVASIGVDSPIVAGAGSRDRPRWGYRALAQRPPRRREQRHAGRAALLLNVDTTTQRVATSSFTDADARRAPIAGLVTALRLILALVPKRDSVSAGPWSRRR